MPVHSIQEPLMDTVRLAYRDTDRTPVIYCIKEMAARHYDLDVEVLRIRDTDAYEAAPFDGAADLICEHLEYLYAEAAQGTQRATMFLSPARDTEGQLVVRPDINSLDDLRGQRIAVRTSGRPHSIAMRIRALGLEESVELLPVADAEVGRWQQWRKLVSGECAATFVSCLYLPAALEAGLRIFPAPNLEMVGQFAHACSAQFARTHEELMLRYVRAAVHGVALMKLRRQEALDIVGREPAKLMSLDQNPDELARQFDCIAASLQLKPYPTPAALANTYEIACAEWPDSLDLNPLTLWDLHWVKQLDDEGFIDSLIAELES
jgi:hypothetical protein